MFKGNKKGTRTTSMKIIAPCSSVSIVDFIRSMPARYRHLFMISKMRSRSNFLRSKIINDVEIFFIKFFKSLCAFFSSCEAKTKFHCHFRFLFSLDCFCIFHAAVAVIYLLHLVQDNRFIAKAIAVLVLFVSFVYHFIIVLYLGIKF